MKFKWMFLSHWIYKIYLFRWYFGNCHVRQYFWLISGVRGLAFCWPHCLHKLIVHWYLIGVMFCILCFAITKLVVRSFLCYPIDVICCVYFLLFCLLSLMAPDYIREECCQVYCAVIIIFFVGASTYLVMWPTVTSQIIENLAG